MALRIRGPKDHRNTRIPMWKSMVYYSMVDYSMVYQSMVDYSMVYHDTVYHTAV